MAEHYLASREEFIPEEPMLPIAGACPDCGGELAHLEGCQRCDACGYSKCS